MADCQMRVERRGNVSSVPRYASYSLSTSTAGNNDDGDNEDDNDGAIIAKHCSSSNNINFSLLINVE